MTPDTIVSRRFDFVREDWIKWGKNALIFTLPVWVMLIGMIMNQVNSSTFWGGLVVYLLSQLLAWLKYWGSTHTYNQSTQPSSPTITSGTNI